MIAELQAHAASGLTTLCGPGRLRGPTVNSALPIMTVISFEGVTFRADTGLTACLGAMHGALSGQYRGVGCVDGCAVREDDIEAGRFDGARGASLVGELGGPVSRWLQFRGTIGEIRRGGAFHAELRGLTEALNRPPDGYFKSRALRSWEMRCVLTISAGYAIEEGGGAVELWGNFFGRVWMGFVNWFAEGGWRCLTGRLKGCGARSSMILEAAAPH